MAFITKMCVSPAKPLCYLTAEPTLVRYELFSMLFTIIYKSCWTTTWTDKFLRIKLLVLTIFCCVEGFKKKRDVFFVNILVFMAEPFFSGKWSWQPLVVSLSGLGWFLNGLRSVRRLSETTESLVGPP